MVIGVFIPLAFLYFLISIKKVESVMIYNVSERKIPLLMQIGVILFTLNFIIYDEIFKTLYIFYFGLLTSSIFCLILVFVSKKASLHMVGATSLLVFCIDLHVQNNINNVWLIVILITLTGMVATSRLYMRAHTYQELWLGFFIGMLPQILLLVYFL